MPELVGIRFKSCGKIYDFQADDIQVKKGDLVVVESELGLSIGRVVKEAFPPQEEKEYKKILRVASEEDLREEESNSTLKKEAFEFCRERIMARGLQMKLIETEVILDRKRIIFYFVSEKRIDFRELVKDLAQKFRTRIEMRQVGVRDEARMTGGIGLCGRELCCSRFLVDFAPISIKMAKKQELVLNTGKLSGCCGRLMCCLSYEYREGEEPIEEPVSEADESRLEAGLKEGLHEVSQSGEGPRREAGEPSGGRHEPGAERRPRYQQRRRPDRRDRPRREASTSREAAQTPEGAPVTESTHPFPSQEGMRGGLPKAQAQPQANAPTQDAASAEQKRRRKKRWRKRGKKPTE